MITAQVEIGFDLGENNPISFRLDDPVKGVLDSNLYILSGLIFYDISDRVKSVSTRRGKSEALDRIDAGISSIVLDNTDRIFDPLYAAGPYFGQLVPRREIRISANNSPVFFGYIEDFDLQYDPGSRSTVRIDVADAFSALANASIDELDPPSELSGSRINRVLDLPEVNWPSGIRSIEAGNTVMLDTSIEAAGVLEYLQLVSNSEFGNLFISKDGTLVFKQRNSSPNNPDLIFSDDLEPSTSIKIPFASVQAVYGSENLYNRVFLTNSDIVPEEVLVENQVSIGLYGARTYSATNLLVQDPEDLENLASFLLGNYQQPLYRFEAVSVIIDKLDDLGTAAVLDLEIGDIVQVRFLPNGIAPPIELPARIIGVSHNWEPNLKRVSFTLETLNFGIFVLDSPLFGQLDDDRLGY